MASKPKAKKVTYYTSPGHARYPKTDRPYKFDQTSQRSIPDVSGEFSLDLILEGDAADREIKRIDAAITAAGIKRPQKKPYSPEIDRDSDEETGRTVFKFKQYGTDYNKRPRTMLHVDAKNKPLPKSFRLTGGSEIAVKYAISPYTGLGGGAKLLLEAVQVITLREYEETANFDEVEDGFDASTYHDGYNDDDTGGFANHHTDDEESYSDTEYADPDEDGFDDNIPF